MPKVCLLAEEARRAGVARTTASRLVAEGLVRVRRLGRHLLVDVGALSRWSGVDRRLSEHRRKAKQGG